jgi:hypothetical protein
MQVSSFVGVLKPRRLRWTGRVAWMGWHRRYVQDSDRETPRIWHLTEHNSPFGVHFFFSLVPAGPAGLRRVKTVKNRKYNEDSTFDVVPRYFEVLNACASGNFGHRYIDELYNSFVSSSVSVLMEEFKGVFFPEHIVFSWLCCALLGL